MLMIFIKTHNTYDTHGFEWQSDPAEIWGKSMGGVASTRSKGSSTLSNKPGERLESRAYIIIDFYENVRKTLICHREQRAER